MSGCVTLSSACMSFLCSEKWEFWFNCLCLQIEKTFNCERKSCTVLLMNCDCWFASYCKLGSHVKFTFLCLNKTKKMKLNGCCDMPTKIQESDRILITLDLVPFSCNEFAAPSARFPSRRTQMTRFGRNLCELVRD